MNLRYAAPLGLTLLLVGCASKPVALVLKPESEKIRVGMQSEEVESIAGKPQMNINDPASGAALWIYKNEQTGEHMSVSFDFNGVAKVKYGSS